ncbi:EAL domain-containing protein [Pseudothauera rhizosphaerae]|nr:EAL domain-containing protein [Pseudothauera rhizosphaerae]
MAGPAQLGLRAKLSVIVAIVVVLVMLPFALAGVAYLDRQGRGEAERELRAINELVRDLVDAHHGGGGSLDALRRRLGEVVIGESGYIFIIDARPGADYGRFVVHPARGGAALGEGDERSRTVIRRLLEQREGALSYAWRNPERGEEAPRRKLAVISMHERLGWLIGASGYEDEFNRTSITSRNYMIAAVLGMAALLVAVLNFAVGGLVVAPMLRLQRLLRTLSRGNETLVHAENEAGLLDGICRVLVDSGGFRFARISLCNDEGRAAEAAWAGRAEAFAAALAEQDAGGEDPALDAVATRRVVHLVDPTDAGPGLWRAAQAAGCGALIGFPLRHGERVLGALTIGAAVPVDLDTAGVALLRELAEDLAFGIASQRTACARQAAEAALLLRERAIEASSDGVFIADVTAAEPRLLYANPAVQRLTGLPREVLIGAPTGALSSFDAGSLADLRAALATRRDIGLELAGQRADGTPFWCECSLTRVGGDDPAAAPHVVGVLKDVTERTLYLRQIEHQAKYDALTGLPNRSLMGDRLEQALHVAHRHRNGLAVAFIDLDHFKLVNDNLGHGRGDVLLREVSLRLARALREGDTAARQGGDEFVLLLPDLAGEQDGYAVLRRVQQSLADPIDVDGRSFFVTCSIGVSLYPRDGNDAETLLRNADMAMYRAKEAGRNAIRFFTVEMDRQVQDRLEIEQELRQVLERGELSLAYQPQVDAGSGRVVGAEALLRWQHPRLGNVPPMRFIPLAEEIGLIGPIGEWVLREACTQARRWLEGGLGELRIAVNVSARQFHELDLAERIAAILEQTGLPAHLLELELTESMLMGDAERTEDMLHRLKRLGIGLALDDFGTGYSSFAYLRRFPIDTLKIDQSFVGAMVAGANAESIVAAIIAMAHSLQMRVVAEGVETAQQQRQLFQHGCDSMQGYLFGRPLPPEEFSALPLLRGQAG